MSRFIDNRLVTKFESIRILPLAAEECDTIVNAIRKGGPEAHSSLRLQLTTVPQGWQVSRLLLPGVTSSLFRKLRNSLIQSLQNF